MSELSERDSAGRRRIVAPLDDTVVTSLRAGDRVLISGVLYTARDAAHKRMADALARGETLPFELRGQTIYYVGPTPAKPGDPIGSAGPTTSERMDAYTPALLERGLNGMIGKGYRDRSVIEAMIRHRAVYFGAVGGAGATIARSVRAVETVAYEDLGTESVKRLVVSDFPAIVLIDCEGNDWYRLAQNQYREPD
ncbi:Fe-S-containing hydro-lyase [Paenibacillus cymbidii]|uniref:Fe-S-containing hydro-lyase n=1 Tax=Paenibacillus cymbidii TaxID=1639034 RepID=UPI002E269BB0